MRVGLQQGFYHLLTVNSVDIWYYFSSLCIFITFKDLAISYIQRYLVGLCPLDVFCGGLPVHALRDVFDEGYRVDGFLYFPTHIRLHFYG